MRFEAAALCLLTVFLMSRCDEKKPVSDKPVFNEFWHSTRFSYQTGASTFLSLKYYNVHGKIEGEDVTYGGYWYYLSNTTIQNPSGDGKVPTGASLIIAYKNDVLTLESSGQMPRLGDKVPSSYVGDVDQWNSKQCSYKIIVESNLNTHEIIKASFELSNGKFSASQDITKWMVFEELSTSQTWVVSSIPSEIMANGDIRFAIDYE